MEMYTVERDGKLLKLKPCQLTTAVLAKLFCLFPESIVLVSDNGYVATPDEDGDFMNVDNLPIWTVTGESTKPGESLQTTSTNPYAYQPPRPGKGKVKESKANAKWTPTFTTSLFQRQKPLGVRAQEYQGTSEVAGMSRKELEWRKYIEVCRWSERAWKKVRIQPSYPVDQKRRHRRLCIPDGFR